MNTITKEIIQFELPEHLSCSKPTEERNMSRDEVRLLVTTGTGSIEHNVFHHLDKYLEAGDVLVVNTSGTLPAALPVKLPDGRKGRVHLSTKLGRREWLVEIRAVGGNKTVRWKGGREGMRFSLPSEANITLKERYYRHDDQLLDLWVAELHLNKTPKAYFMANGQPIKYENLDQHYPLSYYQTFFSFHPGSAEMPSAGRGFTGRLVEKLLAKGVTFAPFLLHTGVSSLEENEEPYPEYMEIGPVSAAIINTAKKRGKRVIAVGTTAVRAIETAVADDGLLIPYKGNTELVIYENHPIKIADGLITGFHEPRASHLHMLQAIAGYSHIEEAYGAALEGGYYWHQFGDLHLILP